MIKAVLFDLDGTLLPMDQDKFLEYYMQLLAGKMAPYGFEPRLFVKTLVKGVMAVVSDKSARLNEDVFWEYFASVFGEECLKYKPFLDEFYKTDYIECKKLCGFDERAAKLVSFVKEKGLRAVLATSPFYPSVAVEQRVSWAGVAPEEFELITCYSNSHSCKPHKEYYLETAKMLGLEPEECLMIGNDTHDDIASLDVGMKFFLLTDWLINKEEKDISSFVHGSFDELKAYINELTEG